MSQVWRTVREVRIEELGDNIFMFKFATEADKKRILTGGPWHFDRVIMVLIEPTSLGEVTKQSFSHASFWVQIHNIPIMCMNEETIREFGKEIGKVEEVGTNAEGECIRKYARLRVSVDVTKPLVKILSLEPEEDEKVVEIGDMEKESCEAKKRDEKRKKSLCRSYTKNCRIFALFVAVLGINLGSVTSIKVKLEMRWHMDHG